MKVLCLWHATRTEIDGIREAMPQGTQVVAPEGDYFSRFESTLPKLKPHAMDADALIGWALPKGLLEIADKLKFFCWLHSGCDDLGQMGALSFFKQRGVKVTNIRGANAIAVAEQAMMFVLALAKNAIFKHQVASQDGRRLFPVFSDEYRSAMLHNRTICIIGVGSIGTELAKLAKGFGMQVLGVRRNKERAVANVDAMYGMDELHPVLAKSDYVVLATPNTDETFQFFGRAELDVMKSTAFLVNVSRGNLVQEKPLYEALTSGKLRGYAADTWQRYEFGRAFPVSFMPRLELHKLPNVICSNDQAGNADDVLERYLQWGTQNLVEYVTGKPLTREVRLELGY